MEPIPEEFLDLFDKPAIATIATLLPDGQPHNVPVWVGYDGSDVLVVTRQATRKYRNIRRDPRATVTIVDPDDPSRYVEVRGTVETRDDDDPLEVVDRFADRYWNVEEYPHSREADRALLRIRPEHVSGRRIETPD